MTKLLLAKKEGHFLLSERFSQDSLENYFGKQRARGGRNENPNMVQALENAAALRVQSSVALDPVRGNCRQKRQLDLDEKDERVEERNNALHAQIFVIFEDGQLYNILKPLCHF